MWVDRHPLLRKYAGTYGQVVYQPTFEDVLKVCGVYSPIRTFFDSICYNEWSSSDRGSPYSYLDPFTLRTPKGTKFVRLLHELFPAHEKEIEKLAKMAAPVSGELVISVRQTDIVRRGKSTHFNTCIAPRTGANRWALDADIANPDIAVAFLRDSRGQMTARQTIRVGYSPITCKPIGIWLHSNSYGLRVDWKTLLSGKGIPIYGHPKIIKNLTVRARSNGYWDGDESAAITIDQVRRRH